MENKYYTPDISEFHVGFEYERMNGTDWEKAELTNVDCWGTMARGYENEFEEIDSLIRSVRVKYLDKEDIESLGFKESASIENYFYRELNCNSEKLILELAQYEVGGGYSPNSIGDMRFESRIKISNTGGTPANVLGKWITSNGVIYHGECKNKSELKQILKMIGHDYNN